MWGNMFHNLSKIIPMNSKKKKNVSSLMYLFFLQIVTIYERLMKISRQ